MRIASVAARPLTGRMVFCMLVAFFGIALLCYWHISSIEERGGGRVHWLVGLVYNWAGKTGTVLLFAIPGALCALVGIWKLVTGELP